MEVGDRRRNVVVGLERFVIALQSAGRHEARTVGGEREHGDEDEEDDEGRGVSHEFGARGTDQPAELKCGAQILSETGPTHYSQVRLIQLLIHPTKITH